MMGDEEQASKEEGNANEPISVECSRNLVGYVWALYLWSNLTQNEHNLFGCKVLKDLCKIQTRSTNRSCPDKII